MKKEEPKRPKTDFNRFIEIDDASNWERMKKIEEQRVKERGGIKPKYGVPPKKK